MVPDVKLAFAFNYSRETTSMNQIRRFIASLLVFLVLLITDLLGLTKVFSFTRPVR